jgi:hypothetical protein
MTGDAAEAYYLLAVWAVNPNKPILTLTEEDAENMKALLKDYKECKKKLKEIQNLLLQDSFKKALI